MQNMIRKWMKKKENTAVFTKNPFEELETLNKFLGLMENAGYSVAGLRYIEEQNRICFTENITEVAGLSFPDESYEMTVEKFEEYYRDQTPYGEQEIKDRRLFQRANNAGKTVRIEWIFKEDYGIVVDVTERLAREERQVYAKEFDLLTGLNNRTTFMQQLMKLFMTEVHSIKTAAFVCWDLDNLKDVNDNYGHEYGDLYLCAFAEKLKKLQPNRSMAARNTGDEFYLFIYGYEDKLEARKVLQNLWEEITETRISVGNRTEAKIRVSAGTAWYPEDADTYLRLIKLSDFTLFHTKRTLKGCLQEFSQKTYNENSVLVEGNDAFNKLVDQKLLHFAMQPIIEVSSGRIYGYEMLMRSMIPQFRSPKEILQVAKAQSKLYMIEKLTWNIAIEQFSKMIEDGLVGNREKMFINSIASLILSEEEIQGLERRFGKHLRRVVLEMTEEEPVDDMCRKRKVEIIKKWKGLLAIDDFGAGHNSETVLLTVSPDIIKIDMDIIRNINIDKKRQQICQNIMRLAKVYDMKVLAEGVETQEEMETVVALGVHYIQGYYVGRPAMEIQQLDQDVIDRIVENYDEYRK